MDGLHGTDACFSPARAISPQVVRPPGPPDVGSQYLAELLQEHQKLGPFMQVLPICSRLLNQEIMRVSNIRRQHGAAGDFDRFPAASPNQMHPSPPMPNFCGNGFSPWNGMHSERVGVPQGAMGWQGPPQSPASYIVKKILRLEVPTETYPNFNFIGRLLGPRGNSLKRIEASTGCRVFIRGKGSIKDSGKEEQLKGRSGYEHLSEPLHILIEAELPANVIDARLAKAQEILEELLKPVKDKTTVLMNAASYLKTLEAQVSELEEKNTKLERYVPHDDGATGTTSAAHRRAKVHIARAASDEQQVSLTVMVMVECDIVDLVLHVLERLRWMSGVSVLSVDADTYSPQALLKALANIKLHIKDGGCWNEALFHEAMTKAVHDATSSPSSPSCAAVAPLVAAA